MAFNVFMCTATLQTFDEEGVGGGGRREHAQKIGNKLAKDENFEDIFNLFCIDSIL